MNGKVYLIGAGPGDPELMTLKAARALGRCDVVLVDELASRGCLAHARSAARVIEVGKRGGCKSTSQLFIQKLLLQYARQGHTVARLKGGDPFVFGRGGEELGALRAAGVEVEVIPGITAGLGAPASLGIPVTHRGMARGVTFLTGHASDGAEPDWDALVRSRTTLVVYMGIRRLKDIVASLRGAGLAAATPACVIENGTLGSQRQVVGTLQTLVRQAQRASMGSPAIVVIGDVVRFARAASADLGRRAA